MEPAAPASAAATSWKSFPDAQGRRAFPPTRWTIIASAAGISDEAERALNALCGIYWQPLYGFLRRSGHSDHDAEDLVQGYFAHLIKHGILGRADRTKGRLRTFLLADLKLFLANEWRAAKRQKRGGGREILSIHAEEAEQQMAAQLVDPSLTPERAFDRAWVLALLAHVLAELEADYAREGKLAVFAALKSFVVDGTEAEGHARAATTLGISEGAVRVNVHRLRARYRSLLLRHVGDTVTGTPEEVQAELACLLSALK
ncbi:MAG: RNA polymerase sigma factor [Prosthecobacter sp.]